MDLNETNLEKTKREKIVCGYHIIPIRKKYIYINYIGAVGEGEMFMLINWVFYLGFPLK